MEDDVNSKGVKNYEIRFRQLVEEQCPEPFEGESPHLFMPYNRRDDLYICIACGKKVQLNDSQVWVEVQ